MAFKIFMFKISRVYVWYFGKFVGKTYLKR